MKLEDFFKKHRTNKAAFARDIGITPNGLELILKGRGPNLETAFCIEKKTQGLVTAETMYLESCRKNNRKPYSKIINIKRDEDAD